ncbi:Putative agmatine deiminase [Rubripirellula lacrimiformis]|uniref:Agmatine deiminase n=1 Tax=Rubripirellula lacrimiformis TaxID=1930273 RepID=A0A517NK62_9BACT|nr:agmatine deiminase family protein [Rubripirellula lacrimiformis]QDT07531.1 Putative agmatine deiminase [Rubripirellula lacrimiformis]
MTQSRVLSGESSPRRLRVPAEWEPIQCVWLAWPHSLETWPGLFDAIPGFYADWVRRIAESVPVRILAGGEVAASCQSAVRGIDGVEVVPIATNDAWVRDYGPTYVEDLSDHSIHAVNWKYNAWGGKYPPWDSDDAAAAQMAGVDRFSVVNSPLGVEGGAMEFDGRGRLLTTPECLVTDTRNPGWTQDAISQELHRCTGVTEIVWLDGGGLIGDDTDGHIDQLARFVDVRNVVVAVCDDPSDANHEPLQQNYRQLHLWGDATNPGVDVHRLPIPPARYIDGQRVPESYCNFLRLGPDRLLVPTFAAPTDDHAIGLLSELSGLKVEPIDCRDLVWGLGALHCASREQPKQA